MRVSVRLHGVLRRHHPGPDPHKPFEVEIAQGSRVVDLVPVLDLPPERVSAFSVNAEAVERTHPLHDGDSVSLFSPVAGG